RRRRSVQQPSEHPLRPATEPCTPGPVWRTLGGRPHARARGRRADQRITRAALGLSRLGSALAALGGCRAHATADGGFVAYGTHPVRVRMAESDGLAAELHDRLPAAYAPPLLDSEEAHVDLV